MRKTLLKNDFFFHIEFSWIFHGFWPRLGGSWVGFGEHFGTQQRPQKGKINFFNKIVILKGFWEALGRILGGFGSGFGKVLGGFWEGFGMVWELSFAGFCIAEASEALWCWLCLALLGFVADVFFFAFCCFFAALHNFCWARHGKGISGKLWLSKPRPAKPSPAKFDIF